VKYISLTYLIFFLGWCVAVVKEDFEFRKIFNKRTVLGARIFIAAMLLSGVNTYLGLNGRVSDFLNPIFYVLFLQHFALTVIAAVVLWYGEIWPAGDAKFFILCSLSLPLINPFIKTFPGYLFLSVLINIFVVASVYAVINYISEGINRVGPSDFFSEEWNGIKERFTALARAGGKKRFAFLACAVNLSMLFLFHQIFVMEFKGFLEHVMKRTDLIFFFLFFLWDRIGGIFRSRKWLYFSGIVYLIYFICGYFFFPYRLLNYLTGAVVNVFKFSVILFVGRFMIEFIMEKKDAYFVGKDELGPGMIPSTSTLLLLKQNPVFQGAFDDVFRDGFCKEHIDLLKDWLSRLNVKDPKIEVIKGRPFALWIFAGVLLMLLFNKDILRLTGIL